MTTEVIEIFSSDEEAPPRKPSARRRSSSLSMLPPPGGSHTTNRPGDEECGAESDGKPSTSYRGVRKPRLGRARLHRIVQSGSSSEEESVPNPQPLNPDRKDVEVIEISDSSDSDGSRSRTPLKLPAKPSSRAGPSTALSLGGGQSDHTDDGGILTLNDPKSARKPLRRPQTPKLAGPSQPAGGDKDTRSLVKAFSTLSSLTTLTESDTENTRVADPAPSPFPARTRPPPASILATPSTPKSKPKTAPAKTPRTTKKALAQAEQAERAAYAQELFCELNQSVFAGGLPTDTALVWSNRLLTTAGRARWHRSKEGVQTTSIELATKILDSDERIRNTISHEMCHLACWVINQDPKEGHGRAWKTWAAKVMRKRSDITISTRHNYEISYPYEWECEHCAKTYGRFSKSIRPDEVVCGACKVGKLHPMFAVRTKTPKAKAGSSMAATEPRDSPRATSFRLPGSFDSELDRLLAGIQRLGVEGS